MPYARSPVTFITDAQGNTLSGASVAVTNEATGAAAALKANRDGTSTKTNPFTAEADGSFPFYASGGRYRIDVTHALGTITVRDVPIGLLQEQDSISLDGKRIAGRVATTGNITIASGLNNGDTIDGVTLATGNVVLVKNQTDPAQNGIYTVAASPARHTEFDAWDDYPGATVVVAEGTANANTLWFCSANPGGTLGTTAIDFTKIGVTSTDGADGADPGYLLNWDTGTASAGIAAGEIRVNNASMAVGDKLFVHKTGRGGSDLTTRLLEMTDGVVIITNPAADTQASMRVTAAVDGGDFVEIAYTTASHEGATSFSDATAISLQYQPDGADGDDGDDGADGVDPGVLFTWDDDTDDSDQGAGKIWANNASLASATVLYLSKTSRGGSDIAAYLATLDDSTAATKGYAILTRAGDEAQAVFRVTGLTDATGYVKLAVATPAGMTNPAAADAISFQFLRTGDAGDVTAVAPYTATNQIVVATGAGTDTKDTPGTVSDAGVITGTTEDAGTNTVIHAVVAKHTSSGTPAAGMGVGYAFDVETSAGNVERGATIEAVATDVTGASEDFDLVVKLMIAGAAVAEAFRVTSAGVVTVLGNALKRVLLGEGGQLTGGFTQAASYDGGTITTGTVTAAPGVGQGNIQHYTNNGAHTLAPPTTPCTVLIEILNGASAGAITTSGFTKVDGSFNTTNDKKFLCSISKTHSCSKLLIDAMP